MMPEQNSTLFSCVSIKDRFLASHSLRRTRKLEYQAID